ncbi:MAG TPA: metallophosphoesterase [Steroidobacteraceae bacterium]|jgi:Icc protein|nr:metallophosphoesterase [Steroidobacteraceae bacterium]
MTAAVRLLQISDPHLFASEHGTLRGVATLASMQRVLAHAGGRRLNIDALVCSGDIVNDEPDGYAHFARVLTEFGKPVYCIPGNHDDPARLRSALSRPPFQVGGHVDLGAWRVVLVDSCKPGRVRGYISAAELAALDSALSGAPRYAIVFVHHHPVPMASRWLDAVGIENADDFLRVLDAHPQLRAVSWGHVHQSFDARRHGVRLLATPSTCAQFLPLSDDFAVDARPPAYRRLTLQPDGALETEVVWVEAAAGALDNASGASA